VGAAARYLYWARHARARQLLARPRRAVPPRLLAAGLRDARNVVVRPLAAGLGVDPAPQSGPTPPPHETGAFDAYGVVRSFGGEHFWRDDADGLLYLFHLHGFERLAEYAAGARSAEGNAFWERVVGDWLERESGPRRPAWHPYPTSVRIVSWAAALSAIDDWPDALRARMAESLVRQARYLRRTIEHDIGGNHVLKNGVALVHAGALTSRTELLDAGLDLLAREVPEQILHDGGHIEGSPSYQREVATDLAGVATLLTRAGREVPAWLSDAVTHAAAWQAAVAGPDGRMPLLSDSWEGPPLDRRAEEDVTVLADSGLHVLRHGADQAVLDLGPLAPPHLPPHVHADALSFVLWLDGAPVVVDPGSYAYTGEARDVFRATAGHNTVEVDGVDQCELWGDFRAAFLPAVTADAPETAGDVVVVRGRHDGYRRLPDPVVHERAFVWWSAFGLAIVDRLHAQTPHAVASRLHLAPGVVPDAALRIGRHQAVALGRDSSPEVTSGWYAPFLGRRESITVLVDRRRVAPGETFGWALGPAGGQAQLTSEGLALTLPDGDRRVVARPFG
jgi:uncharacterized heparinase superfamily protein